MPFDKAKFEADLRQFTGTEHYYRFGLSPNVLCTDGVKFVADECQSFWLLDAIASYYIPIGPLHEAMKRDERLQNMQFWNLKTDLEARTAVLTCRPDAGATPVVVQEFTTDFPLESIDIWCGILDYNEATGVKKWAIYLPSEH